MNIQIKNKDIYIIDDNKIDIETSDLFFYYGAVNYKKIELYKHTQKEIDLILLDDAKAFLQICQRDYSPQDLVLDFQKRI